MNIEYTIKARDDLARIDWKTREKIINRIGLITDNKATNNIRLIKMYQSDLFKKQIDDHVVLCKPNDESNSIQIVAVHKHRRLKVSK